MIKYEKIEEFYINDLTLKIYPTDIIVNSNKSPIVNTFLRQNIIHSTASKFSRDTFSVTLPFDLSDSESANSLMSLIAELNKYPFVFIKSSRISSYLDFGYNRNEFNIYGVLEYGMTMSSEYVNIVVVEVVVQYFNTLPFCRSWSFITYDGNPSSIASSSDKKAGYQIHGGISNPSDSNVFLDFFDKAKSEAAKRFFKFHDGNSSMGIEMKVPFFTIEKPPEDSEYEVISQSPYSGWKSDGMRLDTNKDGSVDDGEINAAIDNADAGTDALDDWIDSNTQFLFLQWVPIKIETEELAVQQVRLVRRNKFKSQQLSGWAYPTLQYLGKSESSFSIQAIGKMGEATAESLSPIARVLAAFQILGENTAMHRKQSTLNRLKINSLFTSMAGISDFIPVQHQIVASSSENGTETYHLEFSEASSTDLIDYTKYNAVNSAQMNTDFSAILKKLEKGLDMIFSNGTYSDDIREIEKAFATYGIVENLGSFGGFGLDKFLSGEKSEAGWLWDDSGLGVFQGSQSRIKEEIVKLYATVGRRIIIPMLSNNIDYRTSDWLPSIIDWPLKVSEDTWNTVGGNSVSFFGLLKLTIKKIKADLAVETQMAGAFSSVTKKVDLGVDDDNGAPITQDQRGDAVSNPAFFRAEKDNLQRFNAMLLSLSQNGDPVAIAIIGEETSKILNTDISDIPQNSVKTEAINDLGLGYAFGLISTDKRNSMLEGSGLLSGKDSALNNNAGTASYLGIEDARYVTPFPFLEFRPYVTTDLVLSAYEISKVAMDKYLSDEDRELARLVEETNKQASGVDQHPSDVPQLGAGGSGTLADIITRAESKSYTAYNSGSETPIRQRDFSVLTVKDIQTLQGDFVDKENKIFAFGRWQLVPGTFNEGIGKLGLSGSEKMTNALQDRFFSDYIMRTKANGMPSYSFITGQSSDIRGAQRGLAREFRSLADPDTNTTFNPGDGNKASVGADEVAAALIRGKQVYQKERSNGKTDKEAYLIALGLAATSSSGEINTSNTTTGSAESISNIKKFSEILPVSGPITSGWGMRFHPTKKIMKLHKGYDFGVKVGTPVVSTRDGSIALMSNNPGGYGNYVVVNHGNNQSTVYGHLSQFAGLRQGDSVKGGQIIGYSGNTGSSSGPHLHYEMRQNGSAVASMSGRPENSLSQAPQTPVPDSEKGTMEMLKEYRGTAIDVHDGDTFTFLSDGKRFKIRLHGIDAPEMPNQKYASESRDRLKAFLSGTIRVSKTSRAKTYDREICTILSSSGVSVNISMVREGWAWALDGAHQTQDEIDGYRLAQEEAKTAKRGLWADADPMNPSAYRNSVQGPLSDQESFTEKYSNNSADGQSDFNQKWKSRDVPITGGQGVTPTDSPPVNIPQDTTGTFGVQKKVDAIVSSTAGQFNQDLQAIKQAEMTGGLFGKGMALAIPTIKVYLVIGIKDSSLLPGMPTQNYTLYEIDGIASASIVTHDESSPVDVATLNIMNPGARFSDSYALNQRLNRPRITPDTIRNSGTPKIPGNNELTLVSGSIIQIRMGYSNNPNDLTICFNGTIRESFGQEILTIVAEGFGRELIEKRYYVGKPETWGGIWATATSYKIISDILGREEIVNFGKYYSLVDRSLGFFLNNTTEDTTEPEARKLNGAGVGDESGLPTEIGRIGRIFSAEHYKSKMFMNLYNSEINVLDDEYASLHWDQLFDIGKEFGWTFTQYNATTWDTLTELTYRHPGSIIRVRPYEAGSTLFWGTKDQLYLYKDINKDLQIAAAQGDSEAAKSDYDKYRHKRMKPITGYHLISSDLNIIRNGMTINGKFATRINVRWDNYANDVITGVDTNILDIQYDDNLLPSMVRDKEITGFGITEEHTAARYGVVGLKYEMEKMYDGEIIILGNPEIRAGDVAYLDDSQKGLRGIIKIREAIHSFSPDVGFVTLITPGVYIEPRKFTYSSLFPTLTMAYHKITTEAIRPAAADATFNFQKRTLFSLMSTRNGYSQPGILSSIGSDAGVVPAGGIEGLISGIVAGTSLYGATTLSSILLPTSMTSVLATLGVSAQVSLMGGVAQIGSGTIAGVAFGIGRSILSLGGMALAAAFGFPGITAVALMVIVGTAVSYSYMSLMSVTRQPLKIYPLLLNGQAYQIGITGAVFNTWADSVIVDAKRGLSEIGRAMQFYSAQRGAQAGSFANWAASLAPITMFGG